MLKVCWFIAKDKVSIAINGNKRQDFKKWDKVLVAYSERLQLIRLWFELIDEKELSFEDIFWKKVEKKEKVEPKAETEA